MVTLTVTAPFPVPEAGERQPGRVVTGAPAQGSAAGVADGQGLGCRIGSRPVAVKERLVGTRSDGGRHGRGGDGEGDGDGDGGGAGRAERDGATIAAGGQGAGGRRSRSRRHFRCPRPD